MTARDPVLPRPAGELPTMDDVAQAAGVSPMTVSRAFRGGGGVRPETRARIFSAAEQLGYLPNLAASELASRTSRSIGIILPTLQDSIYVPALKAAGAVLEEAGYDYVLQTIAYQRAREPAALRALLARRVRAMLTPSIGHSEAACALLRSLPVPHVEFGSRSPDNIGACVGHSDHEAGLVATRRLIAAGRRRIGLICGPVQMTTHARDRHAGYLDALAEAGLTADPGLIAEIDHAIPPAIAAFHRLLDQASGLDGLVVAGEIWAPVVMLEALRRQVAVPGRLSIVGIGEIELAAHLPVPLTVVALPREETGRRAAQMIVALCKAPPRGPAEAITLPTRLIERASV
jgi:DNA-binding LacI/PurR family transcriptional regulator